MILRSVNKAAYHLGIPIVVDSSSLSKANESRDYRIFEELDIWLIRKVRPIYAKGNVPDVYLSGWDIFAIDSTTILCNIKLTEWAWVKATLKSPLTITEISKVIGVSLFTKRDIRELLKVTVPLTQNQKSMNLN